MIATTVLFACATPATDGMVAIPGGSFTMGRDVSAHADEKPAHRVTVSAFFLDAHLVTVAEFRTWVDATGYRTVAEQQGFGMTGALGMENYKWTETPGVTWRDPFPGMANPQADDHPVVMMAWGDADAYCRAHDKRLPTEAEWEYAMRAGATTRYPWGDDPHRPDGDLGLNYWQGRDHKSEEGLDGWRYTSPVTAFPPNAWGLYDPIGNVWQFTADWYAIDTYERDKEGVVDPKGAAAGWARVARGGSWWCSATTCSAYGLFARGKQQPYGPFPNNGFRCAR